MGYLLIKIFILGRKAMKKTSSLLATLLMLLLITAVSSVYATSDQLTIENNTLILEIKNGDILNIVSEVAAEEVNNKNTFTVELEKCSENIIFSDIENKREVIIPNGEDIELSFPFSIDGSKFQTDTANVFVQISNKSGVVLSKTINLALKDVAPKVEGLKFTSFPNPATDNIKFNFNNLSNNSKINIYNFLGQLVKQINITQASGEITWNGMNNGGEKVSAGIYFYVLSDNNNSFAKGKITILR
jgi:hypothetical protein